MIIKKKSKVIFKSDKILRRLSDLKKYSGCEYLCYKNSLLANCVSSNLNYNVHAITKRMRLDMKKVRKEKQHVTTIYQFKSFEVFDFYTGVINNWMVKRVGR